MINLQTDHWKKDPWNYNDKSATQEHAGYLLTRKE